MDDELEQFLKENSLEALVLIFKKHKVYNLQSLENITDEQYEKMGLAIGQIALLKSVLVKSSKAETNQESRERELRISNIIEKIKNSKKDEKERAASKHSTQATKKPKQRKIFVGWLHRASDDTKFKQVRLQDGGGVREITYREDEEISVDFVKEKGISFFFPKGRSKFGALGEMNIELRNFSREMIKSFTDADGKSCSLQEYLKVRGLYASKFVLYLMSTMKQSVVEEEKAAVKKDVFMGEVGDSEDPGTNISGELESLLLSSTPERENPKKDKKESSPLVLEQLLKKECFTEHTILENSIAIGYEYLKQSSYSDEIVLKSTAFSKKDCYENYSFNDPLIQETELAYFDPIDYGFEVNCIYKGETCFMEMSNEDEELKAVFPQSANSSSLILHAPCEVWGYDANQLILCVVASCHSDPNAWYIWYQDDTVVKEGTNNCCLPINSPGSYSVEVRCGEDKAVSDPVLICTSSDAQPKHSLPVIEKEDINFSAKDEIGRGTFGIVYKSTWAGTEVAVKHVKIRNAKRLRSIVQSEVKLHSMVRHPNIVQIMAISFLKNSIYIVSEIIKGRNLDDLIFSDEESSATFTIKSCNKLNVGKQLCQAVAYLHNLKPPVVHRDIKPANVLVAEGTQITKLCDMGLSKLKSAQSLSQATNAGNPGTPSYMAPECLVERKNASVHSDVWSLACTLLELFTEKDCWSELLENKTSDSGESDVKSLITRMEKKEQPHTKLLIPTVGACLQDIITECFQYDVSSRPRAIDILGKFPLQ